MSVNDTNEDIDKNVNLAEIISVKIDDLRASRNRTITIGAIVIIILLLTLVVRLVFGQIGVMVKYHEVYNRAIEHSEQLEDIANDSEDLLDSMKENGPDYEEWRTLESTVKQAENLVDQTSTVLSKKGLTGTSDSRIEKFEEFDEKLTDMLLRINNQFEALNTRSDVVKFNVLLDKLKEAVTEGSRLRSDAGTMVSKLKVDALSAAITRATDMLYEGFSDEEIETNKTAITTQLNEAIADLERLTEAVRLEYETAKIRNEAPKVKTETSPSPTSTKRSGD